MSWFSRTPQPQPEPPSAPEALTRGLLRPGDSLVVSVADLDLWSAFELTVGIGARLRADVSDAAGESTLWLYELLPGPAQVLVADIPEQCAYLAKINPNEDLAAALDWCKNEALADSRRRAVEGLPDEDFKVDLSDYSLGSWWVTVIRRGEVEEEGCRGGHSLCLGGEAGDYVETTFQTPARPGNVIRLVELGPRMRLVLEAERIAFSNFKLYTQG